MSGSPTLQLETGTTDGLATFVDLSDGRTLNFTYTVKSGDITSVLDYVSTKALSLNGGSITVGGENAILLLPKPGETGSLSKNKNIRIDATTDDPTVQAIDYRDPPKSPTNADTLKFRVTFSKAVINVDASDFSVTGVTGATLSVEKITSSIYDITVSGGNLPSLNGTVTLSLNPSNGITDVGNKPLSGPLPATSYVVDNQFQSITVVQASDQEDPAITAPIKFIVTFAEKIKSSTFTSDDVIQGATGAGVPYVSWRIDPSTQSGDKDKVFILSGYPNGNGDVAPSIPKNRVEDLAGNLNTDAYVPTYSACGNLNNDCVVMKDTERPTVTIVQAPGQADPSTTLPIKFNVQFSEPINIYSFTASDITQEAEGASGVTWSITNPTGDKKNFSISAITSDYGILKPIIEENRVLDSVGNGNKASASNTDNEVDYQKPLSVTVDQASKQQDPTIDLPIAFTVKFSEKINPGTFTVEDIVQKGTVTGVKWYIENSDNNKVFILRATDADADSYGTIIPFIPANRVKNEDGSLENLASVAAADGSVTYVQGTKSVVISEVAWMGTQANSSHEWIELFNTTRKPISLDGWRLISFRWSGTQFVKNLDIALKGVISPRTSTLQNDTSGYFLLVANENAVSFPGTSETYDQKYTGSLYNTGEILLLCSTYNIQVAKNCDENHKTLLVDFVNARSRTGTIRPWPAGSSSIYGSMERQDWRSDDVTAYFTHTGANPHFGFDANGNFIKGTPKHSNWAFTVTSTPRPTALPTRTATPKPGSPPVLVLNEVMARAGTDWNADGRVDVYDEFIEVINAGTSNLSLSSYKLSLASAPAAVFSLPSQTLKPGERMVFYGSQSGLQLKDSGDTVRLLRASNNSLVDAVAYPIAKVLDASICRYADGYGSWIVGCYPTPGLANALTGGRFPLPVGGQPVCHLPDSTPRGFVLAECEETGGSGVWNPAYWDSFPGEGQEVWISDPHNKWLAVYQ